MHQRDCARGKDARSLNQAGSCRAVGTTSKHGVRVLLRAGILPKQLVLRLPYACQPVHSVGRRVGAPSAVALMRLSPSYFSCRDFSKGGYDLAVRCAEQRPCSRIELPSSFRGEDDQLKAVRDRVKTIFYCNTRHNIPRFYTAEDVVLTSVTVHELSARKVSLF
jgi:hypothetical protein